MYVTQDVQFHEKAPYFSQSECSLQEEKVQSIFEDNTPSVLPVPTLNPNVSDPSPSVLPVPTLNPSVSNSSISLEPGNNQDSTSSQSTPEAKNSPDVHSEVNSYPLVTPNTEPRYPSRINRGIPKRQYDPDLNTKAKYPINNFISTHRLSESYAYIVN